jgi:RNA polymerase sigma-70 factor (ECF subfamily)
MTDIAAPGQAARRPRPISTPGGIRVDGDRALDRSFEEYRRELTAYSYRMLGSPHEAEDAVQETFLRAWRSFDGFEGRAALRSWLYKITTNVCLTMLDGRRRRALPMDIGPFASPTSARLGAPLGENIWVRPIPDRLAVDPHADPAELAASRETIRLAFIAALQHLPPRQRAVLILRDVLQWKAIEVADLLGATVVSVNGLLRRARRTVASADLSVGAATEAGPDADLLARYVEAFERFDIDALVTLLREDAIFSMPPFSLWLRGPDSIAAWLVTSPCANALLVPIAANASPAFAVYKPAASGNYDAYAIQVLECADSHIAAIHTYLDPSLFEEFDLPATRERPA